MEVESFEVKETRVRLVLPQEKAAFLKFILEDWVNLLSDFTDEDVLEEAELNKKIPFAKELSKAIQSCLGEKTKPVEEPAPSKPRAARKQKRRKKAPRIKKARKTEAEEKFDDGIEGKQKRAFEAIVAGKEWYCDIAKAASITPNSLGATLAQLLKKGLIERVEHGRYKAKKNASRRAKRKPRKPRRRENPRRGRGTKGRGNGRKKV